MRAIFHPEAHEEMIQSARFYEERSEGLGSDFLTAVEETTRRIEQMALAYINNWIAKERFTGQ
jgi:hypothetical protein